MVSLNFKFLIPLAVFILLIWFFWNGLKLDPQKIPSALLNKPLPNFVLSDVMDETKTLSQANFLNHVSLLNVWASWCLSCQAEQPLLMDLARTNSVMIYGLNYKDDLLASRDWLQQHGNPFQLVGFDQSGRISVDLGVYGTPETFIIDKQGIIRYKVIGELTPEIWRKKLVPLIAQLQR